MQSLFEISEVFPEGVAYLATYLSLVRDELQSEIIDMATHMDDEHVAAFAVTVGYNEYATVENYILNQGKHHTVA